MRGCRVIGGNESFAVFQQRLRAYRKKYWKRTSQYSRRSRLCARALAKMERKNKLAFFIESARVSGRYPEQTKWQ